MSSLRHFGRQGVSRVGTRSLAAAFGMLLSASAIAEPPETNQLEPVVVTATRTEQSPFVLPASIDAVTADEIGANQLGVNLSETLAGIPGVLARDRQDYAQDQQISIRGFGASAPFGIVGVRLFVDGIPASFPDGQGQVSHFNLDSADRIEVLRGPFSALYGNAAGGVIQIFTADGSEQPQFSAEAVGGSYGSYRTSANARGRSGIVGYNIDYTHFYTDGYRAHSRALRDSGNGKWSFDLGSNKLTLVANTISAPESQDEAGLTRSQFDSDPRQAAPTALQFNTRKSIEQTQGGIVDEQSFGGGQSLRLMGYYGNRIVKQYLATPAGAQNNQTTSGGVVDLHSQYGGGDARWISRNHLLGGPLTLLAGVTYDFQQQHRRGYKNFIDASDPGTFGMQGQLRRDEQNRIYDLDPYLQAEWDISKKWSALLGVRHDAVHFKSEDHFTDLPANGDNSGETAYYATTPAIGVMYKLHPALHLYASYGSGFDTPTFDQIAYRPDGNAGLNLGLQPARSGNGEFGAKWRLNGGSFANITVFRSMTRDEIVIASNVGGRPTYGNAGRVRRQGIETEFSASLGEGWRWNLAYTYLDITRRELYQTCVANNCALPNVTVAPGSRLPGVPESALYSALQWGNSSAPGWNARLEGSYLSPVQVNDLNQNVAPEYGLLGINGGYVWALSHWRVQAFVRVDNLLDTDYVSAIVVNDANQRYFEPGTGRSAYAGIDLRFMP